jgi:hypothetical protein
MNKKRTDFDLPENQCGNQCGKNRLYIYNYIGSTDFQFIYLVYEIILESQNIMVVISL